MRASTGARACMKSKELLLSLVAAQSERQVDRIVQKHPILSRDVNWKPYGNLRNNFGMIHNQQSHPVPALVEKPINSIDAILTKECQLRMVDPESVAAPQSIREAVEKFFGVQGGDFSEVGDARRREVAEQIQIIAEGERSQPNIIVYDNGEGQHPDDFEETFVSLARANKLKIKFVQGKYNMGSTGVLPYCGERKYQLILSRKSPELCGSGQGLFGFTLVRLHLLPWTYGEI